MVKVGHDVRKVRTVGRVGHGAIERPHLRPVRRVEVAEADGLVCLERPNVLLPVHFLPVVGAGEHAKERGRKFVAAKHELTLDPRDVVKVQPVPREAPTRGIVRHLHSLRDASSSEDEFNEQSVVRYW